MEETSASSGGELSSSVGVGTSSSSVGGASYSATCISPSLLKLISSSFSSLPLYATYSYEGNTGDSPLSH